MNESIFRDGEFFVGCNYWASHAGTNMWHDWRPDIVEADLKLLAEHNIKYLRIFPLWPDFQPINMLYRGFGVEREIRMGEDALPFTEAGRAGVSEEMCEHFAHFCDLAAKYDIKLIVGLVTGWMSGRLYVPELFRGVNVLTDARAIKWQVKFVKYMVRRFKEHSAIAAWDLGNECNCLGRLESADSAYLWASSITNAIKSIDTERPVVSGMHSTFPEANFRPEDLGEILDILCTHPYPMFTPHCNTDPLTENKSVMHAVAETLMYRGLSGKPAFAEEVGSLGPTIANDANAAAYTNTIEHLLWAHNCLGFMWWCAFDQAHLSHAPYDWVALERELGLFREDRTPKPTVGMISDFGNFINAFPYKKLPPRIVDAVCILTAQKDSWLAAYGSFLLAKAAGLDIEFCYAEDKIPAARAYIIPSYCGELLKGAAMKEILARVREGAALYVSIGSVFISAFSEIFGLEAQYRYIPTKADTVHFAGETFTFTPQYKTPYRALGAEVMAADEQGLPVMAKNKYGKGTVYFLAYPLEDIAGSVPGVNSGENYVPYCKFYEAMTELRHPDKKVTKDNPHVAVTEHIVDESTRLIVAVNCVPRESSAILGTDAYHLATILKNQGGKINDEGSTITLQMKPNSAIVLEIKKN